MEKEESKQVPQINTPNHNNKLATDVFIHIGIAPKPILESNMPQPYRIQEVASNGNKTMLEIIASGPSPDPVSFDVEMIDFVRIDLWKIGSALTYISHGVDRETFIEIMRQDNQDTTPEAKYAIYVFKKVK
ncbi:MAG: hypothetical protein V4608_03260 [Bacteroidota bacterium]